MNQPIRAVYLDIGETILDRTREYLAWAQRLDVPAHTFSAVFGAVVARGGSVRDVVAVFTGDASADSFARLRRPSAPVRGASG